MQTIITNPHVVLHMENGSSIDIELLPDHAPNSVNSFLHGAKAGLFDGFAIQRIIPGSFVDVSYTGFGHKEGQYLIPYEYELHPEITPLQSSFGSVCMGGYGELGQAGCEFFFPFKEFPTHTGIYPVFGKVISGHEELKRLGQVELEQVTDYPYPEVKVLKPVVPQVIKNAEILWNGYLYEEPIKLESEELPLCWL